MTMATLIKEKHLIGVANIYIRDLEQSHLDGTWWLADRHDAGAVVECPTSWLAGNRKWSFSLGVA